MSEWWSFFFPGAAGLSISLSPGVLFHLGPLPITTTLLLQILVMAIIAVVMITVARRWQERPGRFQTVIEWLVSATYAKVLEVTGDDKRARQLFPLAFTLFTFILLGNLITIIPGLGAISYGDINLFRATLADYSMVLVMTLIVVATVQIAYILTHGLGKYLAQFFDFSSPIAFALGLMNIIGESAKILSLSFRLFGNVFAGEVLMAVVTALVPYFVPFPFFALSTFSSVIQAYVFALLATIFINNSLVVTEEKTE